MRATTILAGRKMSVQTTAHRIDGRWSAKERDMKMRPFEISFGFFLLFLIVLCPGCRREAPEKAVLVLPREELGDYGHGIVVKDLRFLWKLRDDRIDIKLAAPTKGWVGIGFNPEKPKDMKGANFIIGYVKEGKAEAFDHYGIAESKHQDDSAIDGRIDFSNLSGSEQDGQTVLEFTVPLDSGDPADRPILAEDDSIILLAYGRSDSIVLKHRFRAMLRVNLSTGENSLLMMK
jgi:hypothetical protein